MPKQKTDQPALDLLQGTLDMLILRTLLFGPKDGHSIVNSIEHTSKDVVRKEEA